MMLAENTNLSRHSIASHRIASHSMDSSHSGNNKKAMSDFTRDPSLRYCGPLNHSSFLRSKQPGHRYPDPNGSQRAGIAKHVALGICILVLVLSVILRQCAERAELGNHTF
jgi:hypothetical protein